MTFLVSVIVFSTCNHLLFRAFARFRIDLLCAIVANYATCVIIGWGASSGAAAPYRLIGQDWFALAVLQGALLAGSFFLMGRTTERMGVAVTSLSTRLSVAIPTAAAFLLYGDAVTPAKISGILTAFLALYLSAAGPNASPVARPLQSPLPFFLFLAFGLHATLIKFVQAHFLGSESHHTYVMAAFLWAFIISGAAMGARMFRKRLTCTRRDILSGIVLGCANYGSVYFLIRALSVPGWQSSRIFPTVSIAVVLFSSLGACAIFGERLHRLMLAALAIGAGSILLINL